MLARAGRLLRPSSLHELTRPLVEQAFERRGPLYCVKPKHQVGIDFIDQDLRSETPEHLFDLILCRYVAFTYFVVPLQYKVILRMLERLRPNGYFAIGAGEKLPDVVPGLVSLNGEPHIFPKVSGTATAVVLRFMQPRRGRTMTSLGNWRSLPC